MFRFKAFLLAVILLSVVAFIGAKAEASTIAVNTAADELNTNGQCSLREAITNINNGVTTYADCTPAGVYGTIDTINIPAGTYPASYNYNIAQNVSLAGAGAETTIISGSGSGDRVFVIGAYTVSISGVTITGANIWSGGSNGGAGIRNSGTLTITSSTVSDNVVNGDGTCGGGIFNIGTLTINSSTISGNVATGWWACGGGGIYNGSSLIITNSTINGNSATGKYAARGGGILNNGTLTITNSTISDNSNNAYGYILDGAGILNWNSVSIKNSIVANQAYGSDCAGSINSGGYNLESWNSCGFTGTGDMQYTDPLLGPLQDNGGSTFTHELLAGSPAMNTIPNGVNGCGTTITTDQRGISRPKPSGGSCDTGAFEAGGVQHTLTVDGAGSGSGTVSETGIDCTITNGSSSGDCTEIYDDGTLVSLTPSADAGYTFTGWSGDCDADGQVTMDADKTCTAAFECSDPYEIINGLYDDVNTGVESRSIRTRLNGTLDSCFNRMPAAIDGDVRSLNYAVRYIEQFKMYVNRYVKSGEINGKTGYVLLMTADELIASFTCEDIRDPE